MGVTVNVNESPNPSLKEQDLNWGRMGEVLNQLFLSAPFHGSKQCQTLLRYLVENSLNGRDDVLKERTIGIEVFGRRPDYNTADDPIVRARVGEVRKRLAQHYQSPEGQHSSIHIVIPSGSYRPTFAFHTSTPPRLNREDPDLNVSRPIAPILTAIPSPQPKVHHKRRWALTAATVTLAVLAVAGGSWLGWNRIHRSALDSFWSPIFDSQKPLMVYTGTIGAYVPSQKFWDSDYSGHYPAAGEAEDTSTVPPLSALTTKDMVPLNSDFVTVGDIAANVDIASFLTSNHRSFDLRSGDDVSFGDLRKSSAVLIGAFNNFWTLQMTDDLSFVFVRGLKIQERGGQRRSWSVSYAPDGSVAEDYAVLTRLLDAKSGGRVIAIAGITECGTRAAGEFVTDPDRFKKMGSIPLSVWRHDNLQIVLHTRVVNRYPTDIEVVAVRYW